VQEGPAVSDQGADQIEEPLRVLEGHTSDDYLWVVERCQPTVYEKAASSG
jgi:hypothetical protein